MIVVIGSPLHVPGGDERPSEAEGLAVRIARAAVASASRVEIVGSVGDDPAGDATLLALTRDGIGHVATRRDPSRPTPAMPPDADEPEPDLEAALSLKPVEPESTPFTSLGPFGSAELDGADLELALRYLDGFSVVVVAERLAPEARSTVETAAEFVGATAIILTPRDRGVAAAAARREAAPVIVLEAPHEDPDGVFARTVGTFAAAVDSGADPAVALDAAVEAAGWRRAGP